MRFDVFHHFIFEGADNSVNNKLDLILHKLRDIKTQEVVLMKEFDDLVVEVNAQQTVVDGMSTAVDGIVTALNDILAQLANNPTPAQVQQLVVKAQAYTSALSAGSAKLAEAVANVPVTPPTPPVPTPTPSAPQY
jgi:hypothetical protein